MRGALRVSFTFLLFVGIYFNILAWVSKYFNKSTTKLNQNIIEQIQLHHFEIINRKSVVRGYKPIQNQFW